METFSIERGHKADLAQIPADQPPEPIGQVVQFVQPVNGDQDELKISKSEELFTNLRVNSAA